MATERQLARLDKLIWVLVFGGLLVLVLGLASLATAPAAAWSLIVGGAVVAAIGFLLIVVRSRLPSDSASGAQSTIDTRRPDA